MVSVTPHIIGWVGFVIDVLALWALGSTDRRWQWWGVVGMAVVNALFALQGYITGNWSLIGVSALSTALQTRAAINWRRYDKDSPPKQCRLRDD